MICPEPALGHGQIIAVSLHDRIVGSHGHLSVNFHPLQHGLDRTLAILIDVAVGSDARFKHSLDLVRLLFNLLYVHDQSARGIAEKFTGSRQDDKAELLSQKIYRRRAQCGRSQSLLQSGEPGLDASGGEKFYVFVRVKAEMLEHQPRLALEAAAVAVESNRLAPKRFDGFKLWSGNQNGSDGRCVTGDDFDRNSPDRCGDPGTQDGVIIEFTAH